MDSTITEYLIPQAAYAKQLRPFLPADAFKSNPSILFILIINCLILMVGWAIASYLDRLPLYLCWLYLPFAIVMGNSVIVLLFSVHDIMHGSVMRNSFWQKVICLLGLSMLWMPPTLWQAVHNRVHHNKTNSLADPDRNYLYEQPNTWGKWIQDAFAPSISVNRFWFAVGMTTAWGIYTFRNLTSVILFNRESVDYVPAAFTVSAKDRLAIAGELVVVLAIHLSILFYLQFDALKLILSYFLPIGLGYSGIMFYVYTNHMACRMTEVNDPLSNSVSIGVPKLFNLLHLNFSYHTEHHIFPSLNSDYYPIVQELLKVHYPQRFHYLPASEAWHLLLQTPRHYKDMETFVTRSGETPTTCPLN